eukprot:5251158-Pyramimonas_sp.AAC.1
MGPSSAAKFDNRSRKFTPAVSPRSPRDSSSTASACSTAVRCPTQGGSEHGLGTFNPFVLALGMLQSKGPPPLGMPRKEV